jgi:MFS family permease
VDAKFSPDVAAPTENRVTRGLGQLFTGAWSDRIGRKGLIVSGMWVQAFGIGVIALSEGFSGFAARAGGALTGVERRLKSALSGVA